MDPAGDFTRYESSAIPGMRPKIVLDEVSSSDEEEEEEEEEPQSFARHAYDPTEKIATPMIKEEDEEEEEEEEEEPHTFEHFEQYAHDPTERVPTTFRESAIAEDYSAQMYSEDFIYDEDQFNSIMAVQDNETPAPYVPQTFQTPDDVSAVSSITTPVNSVQAPADTYNNAAPAPRTETVSLPDGRTITTTSYDTQAVPASGAASVSSGEQSMPSATGSGEGRSMAAASYTAPSAAEAGGGRRSVTTTTPDGRTVTTTTYVQSQQQPNVGGGGGSVVSTSSAPQPRTTTTTPDGRTVTSTTYVQQQPPSPYSGGGGASVASASTQPPPPPSASMGAPTRVPVTRREVRPDGSIVTTTVYETVPPPSGGAASVGPVPSTTTTTTAPSSRTYTTTPGAGPYAATAVPSTATGVSSTATPPPPAQQQQMGSRNEDILARAVSNQDRHYAVTNIGPNAYHIEDGDLCLNVMFGCCMQYYAYDIHITQSQVIVTADVPCGGFWGGAIGVSKTQQETERIRGVMQRLFPDRQIVSS